MEQTDDLRAFMADIDAGGVQGHATYDLKSLSRLQGIEREQAEVALMELANQGDRMAIETLGRAKVEDAEKLLRSLAERDDDVGSLAARAILLLKGEDAAATKRVAEGVKGQSPMASTMSAYTLRFQEGEDAVRGLLDALESSSESARANAMLGLREKLGLGPLVEPRQSPLFTLEILAMTDLEVLWRPATTTMRQALDGLIAGKAPDEVGLAYDGGSDAAAVDAFWESVDGGGPVDESAFGRLSGHDRAWAEAYLASHVWRKPKFAAAVASLGLTDLIPALEEARDRAPDWKRSHFDDALQALAPN